MKKISAEKTKKPETYVTEKTFEKHMISIAKSFAAVDERFDRHERISENMFDQMHLMQEGISSIRQDVSSFVHDVSRHDRQFDDLNDRVEKLEGKQIA